MYALINLLNYTDYTTTTAEVDYTKIALKIIQRELDLTMAMCGETNISNAGMHNLHHNPFK